MKTTAQYLDALRAKFNATSDYQLIHHTGWLKQHISRYRQCHRTFDDATAQKVADWLDVDAAIVVADMDAQRAIGTPAARMRAQIAKIVAGSFAALCLIGFIGFSPMSERAFAASDKYTLYATSLPIFIAMCIVILILARRRHDAEFPPQHKQ